MNVWQRSIEKFSAIGFGCFFLLIILAGVSSAETITVGWEPWAPYQFMDDKQQLQGLDVEIVVMMAKKAGLEIEFKEYPWKRILTCIEKGDLDLTGGASKTPERELYADFTEPYRTESAVMFVRKGTSASYPFHELQDIINRAFKLGVETEYYYGEKYAALTKNKEFMKQVHNVNRAGLNYNKLLKGRIDGFLVDPFAGGAYLKKHNLIGQVEIHPMPIYSDAIYFMVSKKTRLPNLVQRLNSGIQQMKADGTLETIIQKWR